MSASSFTWYAMLQGATLGGTDKTTVVLDIKALPVVVLGFLQVVQWLLMKRGR